MTSRHAWFPGLRQTDLQKIDRLWDESRGLYRVQRRLHWRAIRRLAAALALLAIGFAAGRYTAPEPLPAAPASAEDPLELAPTELRT